MENKKLVVGNMKMNLTASEINKYIKEIDKKEGIVIKGIKYP